MSLGVKGLQLTCFSRRNQKIKERPQYAALLKVTVVGGNWHEKTDA